MTADKVQASRRTALPDVPACWAWDLPPLPQPNSMMLVRDWQRGCAICGADRALCEDHDHGTGYSRGWLCDPCNLREGRKDAPPLFQKYRDRNPASMLGVVSRYRPTRADGVDEWRQALIDLRTVTDPDAAAKRQTGIAQGFPDWLTRIPEWTPLMRAAQRVGFTLEEWDASQAERASIASASEVHLPNALNPRLQACRPTRPSIRTRTAATGSSPQAVRRLLPDRRERPSRAPRHDGRVGSPGASAGRRWQRDSRG